TGQRRVEHGVERAGGMRAVDHIAAGIQNRQILTRHRARAGDEVGVRLLERLIGNLRNEAGVLGENGLPVDDGGLARLVERLPDVVAAVQRDIDGHYEAVNLGNVDRGQAALRLRELDELIHITVWLAVWQRVVWRVGWLDNVSAAARVCQVRRRIAE